MTAKAIKIDIYQQVAAMLRNEILNNDLNENADIDRASREQVRLAEELERRAARLLKTLARHGS